MLIYNARIITMTEAGIIENGWLLTEGGCIKAVSEGAPESLPEDSIDAQGGTVLPGFIDAHTHLGIIEDGLDFEGDDCNESTDPFTPQMSFMLFVRSMASCAEIISSARM